jgi:hypothetical protein
MERPLSILEKPNFLPDDIDITSLEVECRCYLDAIERKECDDNLSDIREYIFVAAMETIFGKDVFDYINQER